jgi:hypothetical protein
MSPIRPIETAEFSCRLRGALACRRIGIRRESSGSTHPRKSASSAAAARQRVRRRATRAQRLTTAEAERDLADGPRGVVARGDHLRTRLGLELLDQLVHDAARERTEEREAADGEVADERVRALPHRRAGVA